MEAKKKELFDPSKFSIEEIEIALKGIENEKRKFTQEEQPQEDSPTSDKMKELSQWLERKKRVDKQEHIDAKNADNIDELYADTRSKVEKTAEWKNEWGRDYNPEMKEALEMTLRTLLEEEKLGNLLLDVGASINSPSKTLLNNNDTEYPEIIALDIAAKQEDEGNYHLRQFDIEKIVSSPKTLQELIDSAVNKNNEIGSIIMSDILNYINYQEVITVLSKMLKKGGRIIIQNKPGRGFSRLFSQKGLRDNRKLIKLLQELGLHIEQVEKIGRNKELLEKDDKTARILVVAVKR